MPTPPHVSRDAAQVQEKPPVEIERADYLPSKAELAQRLKRGCDEAFSELVERERNRLFNNVLALFPDRAAHYDDAADICQETFEAAWRRKATYRGDAPFYTWLCKIAKNVFLDFQRKYNAAKRIPQRCLDSLDDPKCPHPDVLPTNHPSPAEIYERSFWQRFLRKEISKIPEGTKTRRILELSLAGLTPTEIADKIGDTAEHVKALKHFGIQCLKKSAKDAGWTGNER